MGLSGSTRIPPAKPIDGTYLNAVEGPEQNISIDNLYRVAQGFEVESWQLLRSD